MTYDRQIHEDVPAEPPDQILWALADPLGKVHFLYAMQHHCVDLNRIGSDERRAEGTGGEVTSLSHV